MTPKPVFWLIAGPNGAGKTTIVQRGPISELLKDVTFLNPDDMALEKLKAGGHAGWKDASAELLKNAFVDAANEVFDLLRKHLEQGDSVGAETVLSTDKYRPLVELVINQGGGFALIYIALDSSKISHDRVQHRVARGGHDVPADRLEERWRRSLDRLPWYLSQASEFWVFNNSNSDPDDPPPIAACGQFGRLLSCDESRLFPELRLALSSVL